MSAEIRPQKEGIMRFKHVMILAAVLLALTPLGSAAQQLSRVAVLPFTVHSAEDLSYLRDGVWDIISTRIIVEGQIEVVDKHLVERFLPDIGGGDITDQQARWLGNRVGADYVVYGSITKVGEYISLDAKVVHVPGTRPTSSAFAQHKGMDEVMAKIDTFAQDISNRIVGRATSYERASPGQMRQHLMFQALGYSKLLNFPGRVLKGVDAGDVDGDGKNEIVVMGKDKLWIYRDEAKELKVVAEFQESSTDNFISLDVIDINEDKRAEICVTNAIADDKLNSFILTYEDGTFRYLAKGLSWYLRVVKIPGEGERLLAQRMGIERDYEGYPYRVQWKGKKVKIGKKLKKDQFPKDFDWIFDFSSGSFTAPEAREFLALDSFGKLRLLDERGDVQWKSSEDLGGSDNYLDRPTVFVDSKGGRSVDPRRIYFPLRIVVKDLDGDGIDDVVAAVNKFTMGEFLSKVRIYDKGHVTALAWDGLALANAWRTQDIPGYVADFQIKDTDNDGRNELVTVSVTSPFMKEAKGILMVYEIYE
jgi:TolB-like protein